MCHIIFRFCGSAKQNLVPNYQNDCHHVSIHINNFTGNNIFDFKKKPIFTNSFRYNWKPIILHSKKHTEGEIVGNHAYSHTYIYRFIILKKKQ